MAISINVGSRSPSLELPWNWPSSALPYACSSTCKGAGPASSRPRWFLRYDCRLWYLLLDALLHAYVFLHRIIVIALYRLLSLRDLRLSTDPFLNRILPIAWTQGEQAYSFATAIIPSLMPFLMKLNTGLGALSREDFVKETTRQESSGNYTMQTLKPSQRVSLVSVQQTCDIETTYSDTVQMRADSVNFQTSVVAKRDRRRSMSSDDSKRIMVKKTVDISYPEDQDDGRKPREMG